MLDLTDIFRLRFRAGPGLGATVRATDYLHFYAGKYRSGFVGLPGPRYPYRWRAPYGWESQKGLIWCGVDATDTSKNPPNYTPTEANVGLHLLLLGIEFGVDVVEITDFLAGFIFMDPGADDHELWSTNTPYADQTFQLNIFATNKPATFSTLDDRLEYARTNFVEGLNSSAHQVDSLFAGGEEALVAPTDKSSMRIAMYVEFKEDHGVSLDFDPNFEWEVGLPNLERRASIFISGQSISELPGTPPSETDNSIFVGVRRSMDDVDIKTDLGVRLRWLPEAFARIRWVPVYELEKGAIMPSASVFYETEDQFGTLNTLVAERWIGAQNRHTVRSISSGKYTQESEAWELVQSLIYGYVPDLITKEQRGRRGLRLKHVAKGYAVRMSAYADLGPEQSTMDTYRLTLLYRRPLHKDWIYLQIEPELEWENINDWNTIPVFRIGFDALFWGIGPR